jgi:hypothetical protein
MLAVAHAPLRGAPQAKATASKGELLRTAGETFDKHQRLRDLARHRGVSINRLVDEVVTAMLAERDAEVRFAIRSQRGAGREERGLALLEKAVAGPV